MTAAAQAGTIIVLIDESSEMTAPIAGGTKPKAESVATAVNSMLNQLAAGPDVRLAILGYAGTGDGAGAQIRWTGPLSTRVLVNSSELAAAPTRVEERVRRVPGVGGIGVAREETIQFPIWYMPARSSAGNFEQAAEFIGRTLAEAGDDSSGKPPMVIHVCGKMPTVSELQSESARASLRTCYWCHLHLGANDRIPATLYPSSNQHLGNEDAGALFEASSILTDSLSAALRAAQLAPAAEARGLVLQASMGDLIRFLMLAKAYASAGSEGFAPVGHAQPPLATESAAVETPVAPAPVPTKAATSTVDRVALIVLADRSQADPASGVWLRRQEQVNDMIGRIARRAAGDVDVGLIVVGGTAVETGFYGPLQGRTLVPDIDLTAGAIRVDEVIEKVSNGIGGLIELKRSRPIFLDSQPCEPTQDLKPAMTALAELIAKVRQSHEPKTVLPLVVHVTGGDFSAETVASVAARLAQMGDVLMYHSIVPETPQPTAAYPTCVEQLADPRTAAFWQITSLLAGAKQLAIKRPTITPTSRGLVVGAKFDLLLESVQAILTPIPDP